MSLVKSNGGSMAIDKINKINTLSELEPFKIPASPAQTSKLIGQLLAGWPSNRFDPESFKQTMQVFLAGLSDLPEWAISQAVFDFIAGKIERNHAFMPSAPEFAACARKKLGAVYERGEMIRYAEELKRERLEFEERKKERELARSAFEKKKKEEGYKVLDFLVLRSNFERNRKKYPDSAFFQKKDDIGGDLVAIGCVLQKIGG